MDVSVVAGRAMLVNTSAFVAGSCGLESSSTGVAGNFSLGNPPMIAGCIGLTGCAVLGNVPVVVGCASADSATSISLKRGSGRNCCIPTSYSIFQNSSQDALWTSSEWMHHAMHYLVIAGPILVKLSVKYCDVYHDYYGVYRNRLAGVNSFRKEQEKIG